MCDWTHLLKASIPAPPRFSLWPGIEASILQIVLLGKSPGKTLLKYRSFVYKKWLLNKTQSELCEGVHAVWCVGGMHAVCVCVCV